MKIDELNKEELRKVTQMYIEERESQPWLCSLEEFCESFVKRCECCGELVVSDCELKTTKNWKGETLHLCDECYEESKLVEEDGYDYYDESEEYQDYFDIAYSKLEAI